MLTIHFCGRRRHNSQDDQVERLVVPTKASVGAAQIGVRRIGEAAERPSAGRFVVSRL
jgi:hypothetical protein